MKTLYGAIVAVAVFAGGVATGAAVIKNEQAIADFKAAMDRMHTSMMIDYTGNPDVDFAHAMMPHHKGAIDMAKVELQYGKDPELRKMAEEIVSAQKKEIAEMKKWLATHGS
jgi:uncharacterized protein (DUF305 family)